MTGEAATFAEGDWNGDGLFNQQDLVAALQRGDIQAAAVAALRTAADDSDVDPSLGDLDEVFAQIDSQ